MNTFNSFAYIPRTQVLALDTCLILKVRQLGDGWGWKDQGKKAKKEK